MLNSTTTLPAHIGIIMDGNGRWAKKRGLPRASGHKAGGEAFRRIARYANHIGLKYLTFYAFSTENTKRPSSEIDALMILFREYLEEALRDFTEENIRLRFIGDRSYFSRKLQDLMKKNETLSAEKTGLTLNLAMNYGGRTELVDAFKKLAEKVSRGELAPADINEDTISSNIYTAGQPDPDLIIRPSGEFRTSNFLLWQSAYAELLFMDILWPDFQTEDLDRAILAYNRRNRRFGGI